MFSDLDYLVINDLTHYSSFVLEEVNHSVLNMIVANHFPVQVLFEKTQIIKFLAPSGAQVVAISVCLSVTVIVCIELRIFIFLAQVSLRSIL